MRDGLSDFYTFTETLPEFCHTEQATACLSLYKCVNQVISALQAGQAEPTDTITNDVHPDIYVSTHKETLVAILTQLGEAIIINNHRNTIHITAKSIGNIGLVHIRSSHAAYSPDLGSRLQQAESLAERLGGCVTFSNNGMYGISVAFTFINH